MLMYLYFAVLGCVLKPFAWSQGYFIPNLRRCNLNQSHKPQWQKSDEKMNSVDGSLK
jgi:hypothetical protein